MIFEEMKTQLTERILQQQLVTATISQPRMKSNEVKRIKLKPILLKEVYHIQIEYQFERILKHENVPLEDFPVRLALFFNEYRQAHMDFIDEKVQIQLSKKNKVLWKSDKSAAPKQINLAHNRQKNYLLREDQPYPFLIRLGVQSEEGKIKKQKYDKFKQINRFIEFIDDALAYLPKDRQVRILDFGSGKSYLTFALYHYLKVEKGLDIRVTGLDLKKEVIEECSKIANDLGYEQLEFLVGDINDYNSESNVDMVVTLHACDVATDMALARAVKWGARVILSVPCCQHELNRQLNTPALDIMLQHGLLRERFAALATDAIRAEILSLVGYEAQLLEFIDIENTPKNILIRAYHTGKKTSSEQRARYDNFLALLNAQPFLAKELETYL
ncbi:class I SAM-dependent methyltransferase [Lysinibacillus pakistanensis]|uniref:SAM-dependent methyltransferase n=1 Tax=Lysinibacillus pakistanensis TaxID=759811 RepID=A0AAX3WXX6_9BACI|nr:SAM-dependent methyltransferase [Lysinibacillus pakistanensis]MDM5230678.1 SAM-dependent methyltransferase [Lysinibacillus pakistanensis]WHY46250.1 SAM-dependent methyltransferase [Lysinibacillus pakistanensis]WHY51262.1 SAM-dependent methyltransferase [Lysinibacillus pakistanensis]